MSRDHVSSPLKGKQIQLNSMSLKTQMYYKYSDELRPYQVDCVKDLNLSYCCTSRIGQVAVIITDGQCTQPYEENNKHGDLACLH